MATTSGRSASGLGRPAALTTEMSCKRRAPAFDCTRCGACCANPDENRAAHFLDYVEVQPRDRLLEKPDLLRRFVVYNADGIPHLRLHENGRCLALRGKLGRRVACAIYEDRPTGCRRVEAGSERCLTYRRERGLVAEG
jgi:Fe-S-cluster containining protein